MVDKAELKMAAYAEVQGHLDESLEAAKRSVPLHEGAAIALVKGAEDILLLHQHVDKDLEEGKLSAGLEPLDVAKMLKGYVSRAAQICSNLSRQNVNLRLSAAGKVEQAEKSAVLVQKLFAIEARKRQAVTDAAAAIRAGTLDIESGDVDLKIVRSAQDQIAAEDAAAQPPAPPVQVLEPLEAPAPKAKAPRKKRARRKR